MKIRLMIHALSRGYVLDKDNKCLKEVRIIGIRDQLFNIWWRGAGTMFSPPNENLNLFVRIKFLNLFLYTCVVLNKNWKIYWSEQSLTGRGLEDRCSLWGLNKVWLVVGRRTGAHCEDCVFLFDWSWAGGQVLIVRTVCFWHHLAPIICPSYIVSMNFICGYWKIDGRSFVLR